MQGEIKKKIVKKRKAKADEYPQTIETFRKIGGLDVAGFSNSFTVPSCFNGRVNVRKYRVTIELVDEPIEVIQRRLQDLWDNSDNWHDHMPIEGAAKQYKYILKGERGSKAKSKS